MGMKILWTDGSAVPNPGPGGFAVIEVHDGRGEPVVLGRDDETTNIRMEGKALIAAIKYANGEKWVDEMNAYIKGNYDFLVSALAKQLPKVKVMPMEGTYLAWLDFRAVEPDKKKLQQRMLTGAKVWLDEGWLFGPEGSGFERIVLACPRETLKEAVSRMVKTFCTDC